METHIIMCKWSIWSLPICPCSLRVLANLTWNVLFFSKDGQRNNCSGHTIWWHWGEWISKHPRSRKKIWRRTPTTAVSTAGSFEPTWFSPGIPSFVTKGISWNLPPNKKNDFLLNHPPLITTLLAARIRLGVAVALPYPSLAPSQPTTSRVAVAPMKSLPVSAEVLHCFAAGLCAHRWNSDVEQLSSYEQLRKALDNDDKWW